MRIYTQIPAVPSKRPSESWKQRSVLHTGCIMNEAGYWHFSFLVLFFSSLRWKGDVERRRWQRVCRPAERRGRGLRGHRPGQGWRRGPSAGGSLPQQVGRCHSRSEAAGGGPGPGRDRGKPGFPGAGLLGGAPRRGGELAVCRGALRSCRRGFPRYSGVPPRLSQKPDRERSSTCDCAGVSWGVSADWKRCCAVGESPAALGTHRHRAGGAAPAAPARPAEPPGQRGSARPSSGNEPVCGPGAREVGRGCSLFRVNQLQ